jgi:putative ABC transport system permease protein
MILENLSRRRTRTLLTIVGIAIGIAAIVALGAVADGLVANSAGVFSRSGGDLVLAQAEVASGTLAPMFVGTGEDVGRAVAAIPGVEEVAGMVYTLVQMPGIPYFPVFGYDPEDFAIRHFKIVEGETLEPGSRGRQVIIGRVTAGSLDKGVGDVLKLAGRAYRIAGIYETGISFEDLGAVIPLVEAQALTGQRRKVTLYLLRLKTLDQMGTLRARILRRFPDLTVSSTTEVANQIGFVQTTGDFAWMISLVAALVGGVGVLNTVMMSIFERRREIGVLRAVGWRKRKVLGMILGESLTLSLAGGVLGSILGLALVKALGRIPTVASFLPGVLTPDIFARSLVATLVLSAAGGLYPAWRAAGLVPVEALRYEVGGGDRSPLIPARLPGGMITRNVFRRRGQSLLTIVGVGVGIMAVVAVGALTDGVTAWRDATTTDSDLVVRQTDTAQLVHSAIEERVGKRIAAIPQVWCVSGGMLGEISFKGMPPFIFYGYHPRECAIRHFRIVEGHSLSAPREMILGRLAAESLDKEVGDRLRILGSVYRIVGIYETGNVTEECGGVISLRDMQNLFGRKRHVSFYTVKVQSLDEVENVRERIMEDFPELAVIRSAEFTESEPATLRALMGATSLLSVLVVAAGLTNTMMTSIFERTREIGVLRALGWRQSQVLVMILGESLILSLAGALTGVGAGWAVVKALQLLPIGTGMMGLSRFTYGRAVRAVALGLVLGALGGLYPAWRATRLEPVEALRYE